MPRPRKCRKVCSMPAYTVFGPETVGTDNQCADCHENAFSEKAVMMTVDEYETVRLIDKEGFSQEECSRYMNVARTTVQSIYNKARKKIAEALVEGKTLVIQGGSYMLCDGSEQICMCGGCKRHREIKQKINFIGGSKMKIAVTYENGQVFQHFGHTEQFKVYDVEDGKVTGTTLLDTGESGHGALAGFLRENGVETLICGGIGGGARTALAEAGIQLYGGVTGSADDAVLALLKGELGYDPDVQCNHHNHEGGHSCGGHGGHEGGHEGGHSCGGHSCGGH